jgi:transposase
MERRQFTREFKLEAVRLIKQRGVSYAQASADLGVHPTQLCNWVKQLADDSQHAFPGQGQMKPEQLEIAQLGACGLESGNAASAAIPIGKMTIGITQTLLLMIEGRICDAQNYDR